MDTQFKEKTYEKYFSHEIARLTNVSFSPDQCDESFLGFDDAFFVPLPYLFSFAPYIRRSRHHRRSGVLLDELDHLTERAVERMPPFRFNLFVQYKRPVFLRSRGAREWPFWHSPYYRFDITPHQQALLERIVAASHGRASTVYAAPAFWSTDDLWQFVKDEAVIENSNIADAALLAGHGCYTYKERGNSGIGHSEPRTIESPRLREAVVARAKDGEAISAKEHIIKTARIVREAAEKDEQTSALLSQALRPYSPDDDDRYPERPRRRSRIVEALETLVAFSDAFAISSYMLGTDDEETAALM